MISGTKTINTKNIPPPLLLPKLPSIHSFQFHSSGIP